MTATTPLLAPPEPVVVPGIAGTLFNPSSIRREEWCPLAIPYKDAKGLPSEMTFKTLRGIDMRAVRCENVGTHSTMYRVYTPFDPEQEVAGKLMSTGKEKKQQFMHHPWVTDVAAKLIPFIAIRTADGQDHWCRKFDLLHVESGNGSKQDADNGCFQRWHFRGKCGNSGFIVEGWVTFYHLSPVADIRVGVIWSDRNSPDHDRWIRGILLETGEYTKIDFGLRNGMLAMPVHNGSGWVNAVLGQGGPDGQSLGFIDGSGIPLVGRMLCTPQDPKLFPNAFDEDSSEREQLQEDWTTLLSAHEMPVYGVCNMDVWDGKWLAHGNVAHFSRSRESLRLDTDNIWDGFITDLGQFAGFYMPRPIGVSENPGRTGDQEGFGATKGWAAVTAGDARWIHYAMFSVVADFFRGFMHYEDGKPLDPEGHPNWTTWSGRTHWHTGQSSDRLGKLTPTPWGSGNATGYLGYDDQHRAQNNLAAVYALTGDPMLKFVIDHISTSDIANVRYRNNFGIGAARAVGRLTQTWSHFMRLTEVGSETHTRFKTLLDEKATVLMAGWEGDQFPGPVDVYDVFSDPRMGIAWEGTPVPGWTPWQIGLMLQGTYAAWKVTGDDRWLQVTKRLSRAVVKYGTFEADDGWWFCDNVHWPKPDLAPLFGVEGEPMPAAWYSKTSPLITHARGGVAGWTFPSILMFLETTDDPSDPDLERARSIVTQFTANQNSTGARESEWWACAKSMVPQPGGYLNYDLDALRPALAIT